LTVQKKNPEIDNCCINSKKIDSPKYTLEKYKRLIYDIFPRRKT